MKDIFSYPLISKSLINNAIMHVPNRPFAFKDNLSNLLISVPLVGKIN